jgi:hypothetical protein
MEGKKCVIQRLALDKTENVESNPTAGPTNHNKSTKSTVTIKAINHATKTAKKPFPVDSLCTSRVKMVW